MKGSLLMILVFTWLAFTRGYAQCPAPDFTLPANACREQNLTLTNLSAAGSFEWDYCTGDFSNTPTGSFAYNLAGANGRPTVEYARDGNKWYAFVTAAFSERLYRLTFDDPAQAPTLIENLGNLDGKLQGPGSLRIIKSNGNWFGIIHNTNNGELMKLSFGNSLANDITTTSLVTEIGGINSGLAVAHDGANGWVCIISTGLTFTIIRLGENITAPAPVTDFITVNASNPNGLFDVDLVRQCDQWYAFAINLADGRISKISFGPTLFSSPTVTEIGSVPGNGGRLRVVKDGENYYLFTVTLDNGHFHKIALGDDLANHTFTPKDEGTFSLLGTSIGLGMVINNSQWTISVVDAATGNVATVNYPNTCSVTEFSNSTSGPGVRYSTEGSYNVSLTMTDPSGISSTVTRSIAIGALESPDVAIATQNVCVDNDVTFTGNSSAGGITSFDWDFDDGSSHSSATAPTHVYNSAGTYHPSVFITGANGCTNNAVVDLTLYDAPVAAFTTPAGLVCTNNEYTFINNTTGTYDGLLQYTWSVDGSEVATSRDLSYTFSATGDENITLKVSIPGCFDELTKPITGIQGGPTVGFTFNGQCEDDAVAFTNTSTGSIAGYSWLFGDGGSSSDQDPTHPFVDPGVYSVALSTTGSNGCVSTTRHDVTIYTSPVPSLTMDLPPFSCSGTPSQFHDATASLPDSNIQSWEWTFGDGGTGTGKNAMHTYATAGLFDVGLDVTTDKGCTGSSLQQVTIAQSPVATFDVEGGCVNRPAKFTDTSTGTITSWQWKIGSSIYSSQNPQHTFSLPGSYSVQLNITGQNNCTSMLTKQVTVPVVPTVLFEISNACAGQNALFRDVTSSATDPVVERQWTLNGGNDLTGQQVEFPFASMGDYNATLQVKTQAGCTYSGSRIVTIFPSPVASFTASDETGPPPLHVVFNNTSTGASSYEWNFFDGNQPVTTVSSEYTYNATGDYVVNLTATNNDGCSATTMKQISVVEPRRELALEDFSLVKSASGDEYLGYIRVRNNSNYRIGGFLISYNVGGGLILRETVLVSLQKDEAKTLVLQNEFVNPGPSAYICAELEEDTDADNNKACNTFESHTVIVGSYPNPADTFITVESILPASGDVRVRLYASSGSVAYDRTFDATAGLSRLSLDVQNLSPGIYVAVITSGSTSLTQRVLIAR